LDRVESTGRFEIVQEDHVDRWLGQVRRRTYNGRCELVEWQAKLNEAASDVAGVLAGTSTPSSDDDPVPTNLVDLIPLTAINPSRESLGGPARPGRRQAEDRVRP